MNKNEFLDALERQLKGYALTAHEVREIITDFGEHFRGGVCEGLTEAQVSQRLGSPAEIARQYAPPVRRITKGGKAGSIAFLMCADVFVTSWVAITLAAVFAAVIAAGPVCIYAGLRELVLTFMSSFGAGYAVTQVAYAVLNIAVGGLFLTLGVKCCRAAVRLSKWVVNFHTVNVSGRRVWE